MDNSEHRAWVGNIFQKFEAMYLEVDDIMRQELQAVGANVKQFCSDLMQDMLPSSSVDTTEEADSDLYLVQNTDLMALKKYDMGMEEDHSEEELLHSSSVETVEFIQLSPDQNFDVAMKGESETSIHKNPVKENQLQLEMSVIDNSGEKNSSLELLSSARDDTTEYQSFMGTVEESSKYVDVSAYRSSSMSPPKFVQLVESCESELHGNDFTVGDPSSEVIETSVPYLIRYMTKSDEDGVDLYNEFAQSSIESLSYTDESDGFVAEEVSHNDVTKLDLGAIQSEEVSHNDVTKLDLGAIQSLDTTKLDESCILVDSSELSSVSQEVGRLGSYKKAFAANLRLRGQKYDQHACTFENLDAGYNQEKGNGSMKPSIPTCKSDSEFSESDWEIV